MTRAVRPRISSRTSGFFFCGMMLLPVQIASGSARKPNSWVLQRTHSSAQPERCSAISVRTKTDSMHEVAVARDIQAVGRHAVEPEFAAPRNRGRSAGCVPARRRRPAAGRSAACGNRPAAGRRGRASRRRPGSSAGPGPAAPAACGCSRAGSSSRCRSARPPGPAEVRCTARVDPVEGVARPELDVGRHLVVAAPRRVQLPADVAAASRSGPPRCACGCLRARARTEIAPLRSPPGFPTDPAQFAGIRRL